MTKRPLCTKPPLPLLEFSLQASPVWSIRPRSSSQLGLPLVPIGQQLLLVVKQLFPRLCGVFCVRSYKRDALAIGHPQTVRNSKTPHTLNNGVHWATLLTESAINALCHINVVSRSPPTPVLSLLGLNSNRARRADSLAQLASNAPLLPRRVPPQRMLPTKPRRNWALFKRIVDGIRRPKELL